MRVDNPTTEADVTNHRAQIAQVPVGHLGVRSVEEPILLLVEDDALVLLVAQEALETGGYAVVVAVTAAEAISVLNDQSAQFAGLVTDIRLGEGPDGWEVARHARELLADLPIIYVTGDSAADWPVHGVPNSVLVQKPYAPAQLVTAISTLITNAATNRTSAVP